MYVLQWNERGVRGCRDLLPEYWFDTEGAESEMHHRVICPRGWESAATCALTVSATEAILSYDGPFAKANDVANLEPGAMKLVFQDATRERIVEVLWRNHRQQGFKRVDVAPSRIGDLEAPEGNPKLVTHLRRERDPWLVKAKIEEVRATMGKLTCEACDFDFKNVYGVVDDAIFEVHHRRSLAEGKRTTASKDLAIVCANCHRIIHRNGPMPSVEQMKRRILRQRGKVRA
jgi:hypothetical protein